MIIIRNHRIRVNSRAYRRNDAQDVSFGAFGRIQTNANPLVPGAFVVGDVLPKAAIESMRPNISGPYAVDWSRSQSVGVDYGGPLRFLRVGKPPASLTLKKLREADLRLAYLECPYRRVAAAINDHPEALKHFRSSRQRDRARIVSAVWIVMEAELATEVTANANVELFYQGHSLGIRYGTTRNKRVTLPSGTTFAYRLLRVSSWTNDGKVASMKMDNP